MSVEVPDNIHSALWEKFLLVAPWGGLGGLTRVTLDVLCSTSETKRLLEQAMSEVRALAVAHAVTLPADIVEKTVTLLASLPRRVAPEDCSPEALTRTGLGGFHHPALPLMWLMAMRPRFARESEAQAEGIVPTTQRTSAR